MAQEKHETRNSMRITWDAPIPMDDGIELRCDVFRPVADGKYPVIMAMGAYGKLLPFTYSHKDAWDRMTAAYPEVVEGSSNSFQNWEVVDPEKFVPDGYVCVRVDSRGAGRSPGKLNPWSPREIARLSRLHRMGGAPALVQRQDRPVRHLVFRADAMVRVGAPAAASRRDLRVGGRGRLLPRHHPSRRHRQRLHADAVPPRDPQRAARHGRARPQKLAERRARGRSRDLERRGAGAESRGHGGVDPRPSARRRGAQGTHARLGEGQGAAALGRQLGRDGAASARQFRGLCPAPPRAQKWLEVHGDTHWTHFYTNTA